MEIQTKEFDAYSVGIVSASVCSSLSLKETTKRLNTEHPTGISTNWEFARGEKFHTGQKNPHLCEVHSKTHKHYLFHC